MEIQRVTYNIIVNFAAYLGMTMAEKRYNMQQYAMMFGTYMGVFWILKFVLMPLGMTSPFLLLLFICLTLCVPFLGYYYTKTYRDKVCGGTIGFLHAWVFDVFMYVCAALLTAVAHYVYFRFIDQGYMLDTCRQMLNTLATEDVPGMEDYVKQMKTNLDMMSSFTPTDIILGMLSTNIYYCSLLSIPTALLAMRRKTAGQPKESKENNL